MKSVFGAAVLIILFGFGCQIVYATVSASAQLSGYLEYDGEHFSIQYPSDWTINDTAAKCAPGCQAFQSPYNEVRVVVGWAHLTHNLRSIVTIF